MALSHSLHNLLHNTLNNLSVSKAVSVCVFFFFYLFLFFFPSYSCSKDCGRCLGVCVCVCVLKTTANRGKVLCGFPSLGMQKKKNKNCVNQQHPHTLHSFFHSCCWRVSGCVGVLPSATMIKPPPLCRWSVLYLQKHLLQNILMFSKQCSKNAFKLDLLLLLEWPSLIAAITSFISTRCFWCSHGTIHSIFEGTLMQS